MIQRIQSFFLVLAVVCAVLIFMFPIATYSVTDAVTGNTIKSEFNLIAKDYVYADGGDSVPVFIGQKGLKPATFPLIALVAAFGTIALICIFLYKDRVRQMRVVSIGAILNLVYIFLVFFFYLDKFSGNISLQMGVQSLSPHYSVGTYAPIVSFIFLFLSQRAIRKDEMKVRAADRLR